MSEYTFKPNRPEFYKLVNELYVSALDYESHIAENWRHQLQKGNEDGRYDDVLGIKDNREFLHTIIDQFGLGYKTESFLNKSKDLIGTKVPYKVYGRYIINTPDGKTITGNEEQRRNSISQNRREQIHEISDKVGWILSRLLPIVREEVGQKVLSDYISREYNNVNFKITESDDRAYDFMIKFPDKNRDIKDKEGTLRSIEMRDWKFDYKANLDDFGVHSKGKITFNGQDITTNIYDYLCVVLLKSKMKNLYPAFISLRNDGEVLLSSEMLENPNNFYLKEPELLSQEYLDAQARELYNKYKNDIIQLESYQESMRNLANEGLSDIILPYLSKTIRNGSLWYARKK